MSLVSRRKRISRTFSETLDVCTTAIHGCTDPSVVQLVLYDTMHLTSNYTFIMLSWTMILWNSVYVKHS